MMVRGLAWLGSKPWDFDAMVRFLEDGLGLEVTLDQEAAVNYQMPDGSAFELFKPHDTAHDAFAPPVAGLLVDDVGEARRHMEAHGAEFVGPTRQGVPGKNWGSEWAIFRAPDGNRYAILSRPEDHPGGSPRQFEELRVVLRTSDFDEALKTYRDGLGLPVISDWERPGGGRGVLFAVAPASIELLNDALWEMADEAEIGRTTDNRFALRAEVKDPQAAAERFRAAGVAEVSPIVTTFYDHTISRVTTHDGVQLTLFSLPEEERKVRAASRRLLPN